jgi:hypothetical protein
MRAHVSARASDHATDRVVPGANASLTAVHPACPAGPPSTLKVAAATVPLPVFVPGRLREPSPATRAAPLARPHRKRRVRLHEHFLFLLFIIKVVVVVALRAAARRRLVISAGSRRRNCAWQWGMHTCESPSPHDAKETTLIQLFARAKDVPVASSDRREEDSVTLTPESPLCIQQAPRGTTRSRRGCVRGAFAIVKRSKRRTHEDRKQLVIIIRIEIPGTMTAAASLYD